jgi:hypothetical protein
MDWRPSALVHETEVRRIGNCVAMQLHLSFFAEQLVQDQELMVNGIPFLVSHAAEVGRLVIAVNVSGA